MMKKIGNIIRIALVIVVIALIFMNLKNGFETNINYSEMVSAIKQEKVKKIKIASDKTYVRYIYNDKNARTNIPNDQVFLTEISDKIKDGFVIEQEKYSCNTSNSNSYYTCNKLDKYGFYKSKTRNAR